jgi:hypothetical protein
MINQRQKIEQIYDKQHKKESTILWIVSYQLAKNSRKDSYEVYTKEQMDGEIFIYKD